MSLYSMPQIREGLAMYSSQNVLMNYLGEEFPIITEYSK